VQWVLCQVDQILQQVWVGKNTSEVSCNSAQGQLNPNCRGSLPTNIAHQYTNGMIRYLTMDVYLSQSFPYFSLQA
jgi:hypothetical protein